MTTIYRPISDPLEFDTFGCHPFENDPGTPDRTTRQVFVRRQVADWNVDMKDGIPAAILGVQGPRCFRQRLALAVQDHPGQAGPDLPLRVQADQGRAHHPLARHRAHPDERRRRSHLLRGQEQLYLPVVRSSGRHLSVPLPQEHGPALRDGHVWRAHRRSGHREPGHDNPELPLRSLARVDHRGAGHHRGAPYAAESILVFDDVDPVWHKLDHNAGMCGDDVGLDKFNPHLLPDQRRPQRHHADGRTTVTPRPARTCWSALPTPPTAGSTSRSTSTPGSSRWTGVPLRTNAAKGAFAKPKLLPKGPSSRSRWRSATRSGYRRSRAGITGSPATSITGSPTRSISTARPSPRSSLPQGGCRSCGRLASQGYRWRTADWPASASGPALASAAHEGHDKAAPAEAAPASGVKPWPWSWSSTRRPDSCNPGGQPHAAGHATAHMRLAGAGKPGR